MSTPVGLIANGITIAVSTVAAADDLMTRRVHNPLLGAMALISVVVMISFYGFSVLQNSLIGLLAGVALYLPLAWIGVVGGGDLKLMAVIGLSSGALGTLTIGFFALIWAAVLGLVQVIVRGQLPQVARNLVLMAKFEKPEAQKLHKIPFAVAIFFAVLTQWGITTHGKLWGGLI